MKKYSLVAVVVALFTFSSVAFGEETNPYMDRLGFLTNEDYLVYVNFPFEVPFSNCELETYVYEFGYGWSNEPAYWRKLDPGTTTYYRGIYWFHNANKESCEDATFEIWGRPLDLDVYGQWTAHEVEPGDIGLLGGAREYGNIFGLSEDDRQYSYHIIFNPYGYKVTIGALMKHGTASWCDLKGVILPNQWGSLYALVSWSGTMEEDAKMVKSITINREEIFIAICAEHFN